MNRAQELEKKHGGEPCEHEWEREYYLGSHTGDSVCTKCGRTDKDVENEHRKLGEENVEADI